MVVLALQPKGYAASLFYTPFDRTSDAGGAIFSARAPQPKAASLLPQRTPFAYGA